MATASNVGEEPLARSERNRQGRAGFRQLSTGNVTSSFTNTGTNQWTTPVANLVPAGFGTRAPAYSLRRMDRKSSSFLKSRGAADRVGE